MNILRIENSKLVEITSLSSNDAPLGRKSLLNITESLDNSVLLAGLSSKEADEESRHSTSRSVQLSSFGLNEGGDLGVGISELRSAMDGRSVVGDGHSCVRRSSARFDE